MIVSNTLNAKEILKIYLIEQKIYIQITKMSDMSITVIYHDTFCMSLTVLYIYGKEKSIVLSKNAWIKYLHCLVNDFGK